METYEKRQERVSPHILASRTILFGEDAVDPAHWPLVIEHIKKCADCRGSIARHAKDPSWKRTQRSLHPTPDEIEAYALPQYAPETLLTDEEKEEVANHLTICYGCRDLYERTFRMKDVLEDLDIDFYLEFYTGYIN